MGDALAGKSEQRVCQAHQPPDVIPVGWLLEAAICDSVIA